LDHPTRYAGQITVLLESAHVCRLVADEKLEEPDFHLAIRFVHYKTDGF
jgi:hypothetical protein